MIHAVILAGGWGRRFWPRSRQKFPKQLLCLAQRHSPVQNLFNLIKKEIPKERIWVVANKVHIQGFKRQLPFLPRGNFLAEPLAKNTAVACGLAATIIKRTDPQAVTVVLSSDSIIKEKQKVLKAIRLAYLFVKDSEALVAVGTRPHRPAPEFGYIRIAQKHSKLKVQSGKICKVEKFIEKPSLKKAKTFLKSKTYLWNSGIFVWQASSILKAIKKHLPQLYSGLQRIAKAYGRPQYQGRLTKEYRRAKDVSIDYGVMEKAKNIYTVVGDFLWQDIGSWSNLFQGILAKDRRGNVISGTHKGIDTSGSLIFSEDKHLVGTVGLRDLIIVHTPSATLVCPKQRAQDVKKLTKLLEKDKRLSRYL